MAMVTFVIINGGNALEGCPESWEIANDWESKANAGSDEFSGPQWKFDCGFKLDYDGPILHISSRFYPPKTHYGPTWDGAVTVYVFGKDIERKEFDCKTIDQLKAEVEEYVNNWQVRIQKAIDNKFL